MFFQIYANRTIRMPPTADLENVKAAKLQDGVLVIEVPVTPAPRENTSTACVSAPAGAFDLCCSEKLAAKKRTPACAERCAESECVPDCRRRSSRSPSR